jgi:hypothetical protein
VCLQFSARIGLARRVLVCLSIVSGLLPFGLFSPFVLNLGLDVVLGRDETGQIAEERVRRARDRSKEERALD